MSITNNPNKEIIPDAKKRLTMVSNLYDREAKLEVKEFIQDAIKKTMEDPAKKTTALDVKATLSRKVYIYFNPRESKYYICNIKQVNLNKKPLKKSLEQLKETLKRSQSSNESLEERKIEIINKHLRKIKRDEETYKKYDHPPARLSSIYLYLYDLDRLPDVRGTDPGARRMLTADAFAFDELIAFNIQFEIKFILDGDMNDWRIPEDHEKTLIFDIIKNKDGLGFVCKDLCELYDATEYFKEDAEFVGKVYEYDETMRNLRKDQSMLDRIKLPEIEEENRGGKNRKTHRRNSKNRRNNTRRNQKPKKQYKKK